MHFVAFLGLMTFLPLTDYLELNHVWNLQFGFKQSMWFDFCVSCAEVDAVNP